ALLCEAKRRHYLVRIALEQIPAIGMQLRVSNDKRTQANLCAAPQRQKAEKRPGSAGRIPARKLLGDTFGHAENVASVFVVITHQRLARALSTLLPIAQTARDLFLKIEMESIGRPIREIM